MILRILGLYGTVLLCNAKFCIVGSMAKASDLDSKPNTVIDTQRACLEFNPRYRRFEWYGPYSLNALPKMARFYWSPENKCWMTEIYERARGLIQYADSAAKAELLRPLQRL